MKSARTGRRASSSRRPRRMSEAVWPPGWPAMSIAQANALITQPGSVLEVDEIDIRGVRTKVWKNLPPSLRSVVEAGRAHGERIFLVYEDERVSFEAFYPAVALLAVELAPQGGGKGDRGAGIMRNLPGGGTASYPRPPRGPGGAPP